MKISEDGELILNVRIYPIIERNNGTHSKYSYTYLPIEQYTKMEGIKKLKLNLTALERIVRNNVIITEITTESITWSKSDE